MLTEFNDIFQISSQVWERKKNGVLVKIQFLPTHRPVSIKHFVVKNQNFLLVLEGTDTSSVYWWEGTVLILFSCDSGVCICIM